MRYASGLDRRAIATYDQRQTTDGNNEMPEKWIGEVAFDKLPEDVTKGPTTMVILTCMLNHRHD
eukprot:9838722-Lingulodinium_polyedra.AAC.1